MLPIHFLTFHIDLNCLTVFTFGPATGSEKLFVFSLVSLFHLLFFRGSHWFRDICVLLFHCFSLVSLSGSETLCFYYFYFTFFTSGPANGSETLFFYFRASSETLFCLICFVVFEGTLAVCCEKKMFSWLNKNNTKFKVEGMVLCFCKNITYLNTIRVRK